MRAYICADLHCEFHADGGRTLIAELPAAEVAIVAGDLAVASGLPPALKLLADKYPHVVYVAGNHEYYHSSLPAIEEIKRTLDLPNVHWLEDETCKINGIHLVGCTLWFGEHQRALEDQISDFRVIAGFRAWVHEKNRRSLEVLRKNVTGDSIVVTHHLPGWQSIVPKYQGSPLNCFFACPEAEAIVLERAPRLWIHGHTHESLDYQLGRTRILCNPFGYAGVETNPSFQKAGLVLDL